MNTAEKAFFAYEDEIGESYYCPVEASGAAVSTVGVDLDECVEASTAGRYSGNLNIVDRLTGQESAA